MAAITGCTSYGVVPSQNRKILLVKTPATADSADTVDLTSSTITGGETISTVDFVIAWDNTTGDIVTATQSAGVVTLDAAGGTTDHTYSILVVGQV